MAKLTLLFLFSIFACLAFFTLVILISANVLVTDFCTSLGFPSSHVSLTSIFSQSWNVTCSSPSSSQSFIIQLE